MRKRYRFERMKPGDSFFVAADDQRRAMRAAHGAAYVRGFAIATRAETRRGRRGIRVYLLADRRAEAVRVRA